MHVGRWAGGSALMASLYSLSQTPWLPLDWYQHLTAMALILAQLRRPSFLSAELGVEGGGAVGGWGWLGGS